MKEQAFQGVVKSIDALKNGGKIIQKKRWWLFKWGNFMNMVIGGKQKGVKKTYLDLANGRRDE
jgi:hypothetical protein